MRTTIKRLLIMILAAAVTAGACTAATPARIQESKVISVKLDGESRYSAAYEVLERAQAAGVAAVKPGVSAEEIDAVTRQVIVDGGFGEFFSHHTGHGIGLSTHEQPFIIAGNDLELSEGMAFSVEPGIYKPGEWGMRIEDIVKVTATGGESLNFQPRTLR